MFLASSAQRCLKAPKCHFAASSLTARYSSLHAARRLRTEEDYRTSAAVRTEEDEAMDEMIRQQDARRAGQYNILEEPMDK